MLRDALVADLRRLIGADAVLTDEPARIAARTDFITRRGVPGAVARPATGEQVAALVGFAAERGVGVVARGAGTNLAAGMAPNDDSLVLELAGAAAALGDLRATRIRASGFWSCASL